MPGRFAKPRGLRALRVRIPCLPLDDWPDGETEITPGFYPGIPGSNPGWANVCLRKGHPIGDGNRLEAGRTLKRLAGSTPAPSAVAGSGAGFRRQIVNLFDSGSIPLGHLRSNQQACSWESSQPPKLTHGVRILTLVLQRWLRTADVARLRKASVL